MKETVTTAASAAFLLNEFWMDWFPFGWQLLIGGLGGVVLALTAYNKWLDAQIKRKDLSAPAKSEDAP